MTPNQHSGWYRKGPEKKCWHFLCSWKWTWSYSRRPDATSAKTLTWGTMTPSQFFDWGGGVKEALRVPRKLDVTASLFRPHMQCAAHTADKNSRSWVVTDSEGHEVRCLKISDAPPTQSLIKQGRATPGYHKVIHIKQGLNISQDYKKNDDFLFLVAKLQLELNC